MVGLVFRLILGVPIILVGAVVFLAGFAVSIALFPIGPLLGIPMTMGGGWAAGVGLAILASGGSDDD